MTGHGPEAYRHRFSPSLLAAAWAGSRAAPSAPAVPGAGRRRSPARAVSTCCPPPTTTSSPAPSPPPPRSDWVDAMALGNQGQDTTARQLLQWRYALDRDSGAKFAEMDAVLKMATGWPLRTALYARAEAAITPDMAPAPVIAWFGRARPSPPSAASGWARRWWRPATRHAAAQLIRQGWSEGSFDASTEADILAQDAAYLTPESDRARLDWLAVAGRVTAARRQMARVDRQHRRIWRRRPHRAGVRPDAGQTALAKVSRFQRPRSALRLGRALRADGKDARAHAMLLRWIRRRWHATIPRAGGTKWRSRPATRSGGRSQAGAERWWTMPGCPSATNMPNSNSWPASSPCAS